MKRLAITPGDLRGIGPEIVLKAAQKNWNAELVLFADQQAMEEQARQLNIPINLHEPGKLSIVHVPYENDAQYMLACIDTAAQACQTKTCDALVTGPIHKATIIEAGYTDFKGHTEYLATLDGRSPDDVVMLFVSESCRVALITIHLPLRDVSQCITPDYLSKKLNCITQGVRQHFNIKQPHVYVCGLNPHAGESGHLGREEIDIIAPVLKKMHDHVQGPFPADIIFTPPYLKKADVIVAMYHDQGLAPFKALSFGKSCNMTLGLSFKRTSVDHGTAFDIAGQHLANPDSLCHAIAEALR